MASPVGAPILDHFAALRDPRQRWKVTTCRPPSVAPHETLQAIPLA